MLWATTLPDSAASKPSWPSSMVTTFTRNRASSSFLVAAAWVRFWALDTSSTGRAPSCPSTGRLNTVRVMELPAGTSLSASRLWATTVPVAGMVEAPPTLFFSPEA